MKVMFVTIEAPSLKKGGPVRVYNLIKQAAKQGAIVELISITEKGESLEHLKSELGLEKVIAVPQKDVSPLAHLYGALILRIPPYFTDYRASGLAETVLAQAIELRPDIIQLVELHAYDAIAPIIPKLKTLGIKIILDSHNVEHKLFRQAIKDFSPVKRLLGLHIAPKLHTIELEAATSVDHIFACSEADREFFVQVTKENKVTLAANGVDCAFFSPQPLARGHNIVFAGGMHYPPNDDALRFYFQEVHPLVKKKVPDIKITLLGGEPARWLQALATDDTSIVTPGLVPDVRPYIRGARVCISPMRIGSGTSLKILEYMGSGKAIVSTTVGVRGIICEHEKEVLIADTAEAFAHSIINLMTDEHLALRLGENARKKMETTYDWKIAGQAAMKTYEALIKRDKSI